MSKDNLRDLLDGYYEERIVYDELITFYDTKILDGDCKAIWEYMKENAQSKLKELEIDIDYIQKELYNNSER